MVNDPKGPGIAVKTAATMMAIGPVMVTHGAMPFVNQHRSGHSMSVTIDQAQLDRGVAAANAYTDTKVATLGGRLDVIDARLRGVDDRLSLMASLPADLASIKAQMPHLATKTELAKEVKDAAATLRNHLYFVGLLLVIATFMMKYALPTS